MGGLGCDNMTVVLVCLLQHQNYEIFRQKCARPRRPTPPPSVDGDDDLHGGFVTPPRTPIANMAPTSAALILNVNDEDREKATSGGAAASRSPPSVDMAGGAIMDSTNAGDQTVPEVVRESSSDSEPTVSPAKQGKMSFTEEELTRAAVEHPKEHPIPWMTEEEDRRQLVGDEDAPPVFFSSESSMMDEFQHPHDVAHPSGAENSRRMEEGKSEIDVGGALPSPMDTTTAAAPATDAPQKPDDEKRQQSATVEH